MQAPAPADSPNFLQAQISPSNRAQCRKCKAKIEKNVLRVAIGFDDGERKSLPWYHIECFFLPKRYIQDDVQPADVRGFESLSEEHKLALEDRLIKLKSGEIKKKRASAKKGEQPEIQPEDPTKYKEGGYTEFERKEFEDYKKEYSGFSVKELQAMLQYNDQPRTGTKDQILERVADGWLLGSIPKCPECEQGKLEFNRYDGTYKCKGFFDGDAGHFRRCGRKFKRDEIERDQFA